MLPYDGVSDEDPIASTTVKTTTSVASQPSTSAWQWNAQYGLYFNAVTKQWAKPLPDGSWEYAPAVTTSESTSSKAPSTTTTTRRKWIDRDNPEQEDEKYDPAAVSEEQVWPGNEGDHDDEEATAGQDPFANAPLLRLVVSDPRPDPSVLPQAQQVASIDPGEPVSIGRDKSFERRIRLKELAVSKSHATIFWTADADMEETGGCWAIVDNASTHGTFIKGDGEKKYSRLSDPKVASVPSRLHHLDSIRTGSTTFAVHIHPSFACSHCSVVSDSSNLIPLVTTPPGGDRPDTAPTYQARSKKQKEVERREQMAGLKAQFLKPNANGRKDNALAGNGGAKNGAKPVEASASRAGSDAARATKRTFVDRAAARRQRDAGTTAAVPNALSRKAAPSPFFNVPGATAAATAASSSTASGTALAKPADPFAADSKGAQLLSKLASGGARVQAGPNGARSAANDDSGTSRLGTLIEARTTLGGPGERRAGLGSRELVVGVENVAAAQSRGGSGATGASGEKRDWRDVGKERSYKRFREV